MSLSERLFSSVLLWVLVAAESVVVVVVVVVVASWLSSPFCDGGGGSKDDERRGESTVTLFNTSLFSFFSSASSSSPLLFMGSCCCCCCCCCFSSVLFKLEMLSLFSLLGWPAAAAAAAGMGPLRLPLSSEPLGITSFCCVSPNDSLLGSPCSLLPTSPLLLLTLPSQSTSLSSVIIVAATAAAVVVVVVAVETAASEVGEEVVWHSLPEQTEVISACLVLVLLLAEYLPSVVLGGTGATASAPEEEVTKLSKVGVDDDTGTEDSCWGAMTTVLEFCSVIGLCSLISAFLVWG